MNLLLTFRSYSSPILISVFAARMKLYLTPRASLMDPMNSIYIADRIKHPKTTRRRRTSKIN